MRASLQRLMSDGAVLFFFLGLLLFSARAWHVAPYIPTPWYLNTSASVNLLPGSAIIDTFSLYNSDYYALTGINGSNSVGFYRYRVGSNGWVGVNTTLDAIPWGYDNQRTWSTAAVTVNPWTTIPYIIYVYSNQLVFQQYPLPDTVFNGSSNIAVGTPYIVNLPNVVPNPNVVAQWVDSSTLVLGIHPYTAPKTGIQSYFIIGRFHFNATGIAQQSFHHARELVYSIEFECSTCSTDNVRLTFSNGTMRSLKRNGNQYTWSSPLSTTSPKYVNPELSHKCYVQDRTYQMFIAPRSGWNGGFHRIIDTIPGRDLEILSGPEIPPLASPFQMDIHCHGNLVYTARATTSIYMEQEPEWSGGMNSHGKGKTEIFIYGGFVGDFFSEQRVLVLSTPGNDNVSRIYVDDNQFHIIGFTEGDIADNTITSFSDKLFFAGFSSFDIVSVLSTDAMANSYPFELLPNRDFVIRFSSIPANRSATFVPTITMNAAPCTNVRWIGDALYAVSPPILDIYGNISVEFNQYPHLPRLSRMISSRRPSIVNMSPEVTDIAPFTIVRFTVLYMGLSELSATTIFVGNQRCEIQTDGVVPNFFNGTVFNCSVPFESIGTKPVNFTTVDRTVFSNFSVTYRHIPQNISITIDEGQETPIILNCSAFSTLFNRFDYRVLKTPPNSYGLLLFENKTEFPNGSNVDVGDTLGRMRLRSTSHGRVDFRYYCLEGNSTAPPLFGTVVVDIRPVIQCLNTVPTTGTFSLDDRSATPTNLTYTFLAVPSWGKLTSDAEPFKLFEQGDTTAETSIRLNGRLAVNQSQSGSFSYIATNQYGLTSDRCDVGFFISCRPPLFLNVFNFSSNEFCSVCPVGATCSINGGHLPYAARGYWTRVGEYNPNAIYLPCVPENACPGLPSGDCLSGFRGFRCGECAAKYYRFGNDCLPCKTGHEVNTILAFAIIIGGGALAYGLSKLVKAGPTFGLVSVLISFLQTIVILRGFQLNWPPEFYAVIGWLSAINFNIEFTAPECFIGDFISYSQKLRVTLFLPIFFIGIAFVLSKLTIAFRWIRSKLLRSKRSTDRKSNDIFKSFNAILLFLYTSMATATLGHFDCNADVDGNSYLNRNASLKCYENTWNHDLPFVVTAICVYVVGIPIYFGVMFYFMYQKRHNGKFWTRARVVALRIMKFDEYYRPDRQYFVLFNLLQKLALVAAGVYFTDQRGIQTVLTLLFLNATLFLSNVYKPFTLRILNTAEQLSFAASIAVLALGLPFLTDTISSSVRSFLTFVILSVIFGFIFFIIVGCLMEARTRISSPRLSFSFRKKSHGIPSSKQSFLMNNEPKLKA